MTPCKTCECENGVCIHCGRKLDEFKKEDFSQAHMPVDASFQYEYDSTLMIDNDNRQIGLAFRGHEMDSALVWMMDAANARAYAQGIINVVDAMERGETHEETPKRQIN